jgi:hypothetical protein
LPDPDSPVITTSSLLGDVEVDVLEVVRARAAHADRAVARYRLLSPGSRYLPSVGEFKWVRAAKT